MNKIKIGFIGFGNMAQAIAEGLIKKDAVSPKQIYANARNIEKLKRNTEDRGMNYCKDVRELIEVCDLVVLSVKPHMVEDVLSPLDEDLKGKVLISIVAGLTYDYYESILKSKISHISIIPSVPVAVGEGILIFEEDHSLNNEELEIVTQLFSQIGLIQYLNGSLINLGGIMAGSSPAFTSMFAEALADVSVLHGMPRDISNKLIAQMLLGTGKLLLEKDLHPGELKDSVCSPGGSTIRGVTSLEENNFRSTIIRGVSATMED